MPLAHFRSASTGGRVGIAGRKNPSYTLDVAGDFRCDNNAVLGGDCSVQGSVTASALSINCLLYTSQSPRD